MYGVAGNGGASGYGTVFKVTPVGGLTALYSFCALTNCADGSYPFGGLVLGTDGNFYGTTQNGGSVGLGTVFKITPSGALTVLHSFGGTDGSYPDAGLALGADGNFYGTTSYGGASNSCLGECGTVFKITPAGVLTTLHTFDGSDGADPFPPLVQGTDGNFYGTTAFGGTSNACNGGSCGTAFKITPSGKFTSLHSFGFTDGGEPLAPLVQADSGALYGTTFEGGDANSHGCTDGCGTIFKISSGGAFSTAYKFHGGGGGNPQAGLAQATDGDLYGESPNAEGGGEIFKLTPPIAVTTVYSFSPSSGGGGTTAVLQAPDGEFYGTYGATYGGPGAIFSLDTGLGPFVALVIPTGRVGQSAQILGQGLTGTTSVTFNGVAATSLAVVSDTYMTAAIPSGASTGPVVVTTPTGTLTSNVNFRVIK
jgi:uncharacterized repeat protein (TIGR03803 family)